MSYLFRSEWMNLTSTRLLWGVVPGSLLVSIAAVLGAVLSAEGAGVDLEATAGVNRALHVSGTGSILVLALGIIISAGEYRTQTAIDTFLTTPQRGRVLAAKMVIGATAGLTIGALSAATTLVAAQLAYGIEDASFPTSNNEVWLTLAGAILYAGLFGLLGVAIGGLIRNQVVAIIGAFAWILVIENVIISVSTDFAQWLPGAAGQAIVRTPDRDLLAPATATVLLAAYGLTIAAVGIAVSARRDA